MPEQEVIEDLREQESTTEKESTQDWDKEKQRADMEHANFLKAKTEKETLATTYETRIADLESKIKVNQDRVEIEELDPLRADVPDLVNQNRLLINELKDLKKGYSELKSLATEFQTTESNRKAETKRQSMIDKICKPLDKQYGAKYRNKAVKAAEDAVQNGTESQPSDAIDAYFMLETYYKKLKETDETKPEKKVIPTDNGSGAFSFMGAEIKEGSLDSVLAQIRKVGRKT